ncbi:MAG: hypothetical protein Q6362_002265 [Candidatus Wukongarchaeota archaeon]|nr:hypothetical protein [Candidatus Wukongarchaeota archaeon]MDO8128259.1 hypothetical protein [Candidatus Wukongarchaeota archaeon]
MQTPNLGALMELQKILIKLIDEGELALHAEYILEDLDQIIFLSNNIFGPQNKIALEAEQLYKKLYKKYREKFDKKVKASEGAEISLRGKSWLNILKHTL